MRIEFRKNEIDKIVELYVTNGLNTSDIGMLLGVSKTPIIRVLKDKKILRIGKSNGIKINLTIEQENIIKDLYLQSNKTCDEISEKTGLSSSFIDKYLSKSGFRRSKSEAMSILKKGVKLSDDIKFNMKKAQQKLVRSGNKVQTGGVCKHFIINGLKCQGTYEKFYIEYLIENGSQLPTNCEQIITPFGVYIPDFKLDNKFIEIKSDYTYNILIGKIPSRYTNKIDLTQYNKIKWVNDNISKIDILIVDKRNKKIIKKLIK